VALLRGRERIVAQLVLDVLVLQAAQPLVSVGNVVEGLDHLGLELGLDGGERERVLHIVVVDEIRFARRGLAALALFPVIALGRSLERGGRRGRGRPCRRLRQHRGAAGSRLGPCCRDRLPFGANHRRRHGLGVGTGIGCFEVDDVAE
jgi:hypothetical protein